MQRVLIALGVLLVLTGLFWPWLGKLPFGRLPGDLRIEKDGFVFYFPIVSGIVISVVVSLILWLLKALTK